MSSGRRGVMSLVVLPQWLTSVWRGGRSADKKDPGGKEVIHPGSKGVLWHSSKYETDSTEVSGISKVSKEVL